MQQIRGWSLEKKNFFYHAAKSCSVEICKYNKFGINFPFSFLLLYLSGGLGLRQMWSYDAYLLYYASSIDMQYLHANSLTQ